MSKFSNRKGLGYAAIVGAGAATAAAIALPGAFAAGAPAPFFQHGTNGYAAPSNGSAMQVNEGLGGQGALLTSVANGQPSQAGYGNVGVNGGDGTAKTFGGLTDVETEFNVTQGTCAGGAPRWVFNLSNPSNPKDTEQLIVYFDVEHGNYGGCDPGTHNEPNIINNGATAWWASDDPNTPKTYGQVNTTYGSWTLKNVEVQVDGGWAQSGQLHSNIQQVLLQNLRVNNASYFKLPS